MNTVLLIADQEYELSAEAVACLKIEEQQLRRKLMRIKAHAIAHLRETRQKARDLFQLLDDWIGTKFQAEMNAIKEGINLFKEAIEAEKKISYSLILEGEKFKVDYGFSINEIPQIARAPSPSEFRRKLPIEQNEMIGKALTFCYWVIPSGPEAFTIQQILNLGLQLKDLTATAFMSSKEFTEALIGRCNFTVKT